VAAVAAAVVALAWMACSAAVVSVSSIFWEMLSECRTVAWGRYSITVSTVLETRWQSSGESGWQSLCGLHRWLQIVGGLHC